MSSQINGLNIPVLENKKQVAFKQNPVPPQENQQQTSMQGQGTPAERQQQINQAVDNSYLAKRVNASQENNPLATAALGVGSWYGISQGMEYVNNKLSSGDYAKTIYGKLGNAGDKFTEKTLVGKYFQKAVDGSKSLLESLSKKSRFVNSLTHFSTSPEWSLVKGASKGPESFLLTDIESVLETFMSPIAGEHKFHIFSFGFGPKEKSFQKLEQYGMSQKDINAFKDSVKTLSDEEQILALQRKEIEMLGADKKTLNAIKSEKDLSKLTDMAKELKSKKFGFKSFAEFEALKGSFIDNPDKVLNMMETASKDSKLKGVSIWRDETTTVGKGKSHAVGRFVSFSEMRNKLYVVKGKINKSTLGRALPKGLAWLFEGGTNRFGGGKLGVIMQATILADILYNTITAPKGEHIKTFAERVVNDFTYFVGMAVGILGMHKLAGAGKYIGLNNQADLKAYREGLKAFNEKVKAGLLNNKKAYKFAEKRLDVLLGKKNIKGFFNKTMFKLGKFINMGNERKLAYVSTSKHNLNWLRKMANGNILGVPMRFAIPMMMVTPFLVKLTTTTAHKIFGRPTHSVLDEDEEKPEEKQEQANQVNGQNQQVFKGGQNPNVNQPEQQVSQQPKNPQDYPDSNLIKMAANGKKPVTRTYVPSPECGIPGAEKNKKQMAPARSYIPNPQGVVLQGPDMTAANQALAEAALAEKQIHETLASLNQ